MGVKTTSLSSVVARIKGDGVCNGLELLSYKYHPLEFEEESPMPLLIYPQNNLAKQMGQTSIPTLQVGK
jgi:hypothetical protein